MLNRATTSLQESCTQVKNGNLSSPGSYLANVFRDLTHLRRVLAGVVQAGATEVVVEGWHVRQATQRLDVCVEDAVPIRRAGREPPHDEGVRMHKHRPWRQLIDRNQDLYPLGNLRVQMANGPIRELRTRPYVRSPWTPPKKITSRRVVSDLPCDSVVTARVDGRQSSSRSSSVVRVASAM
jgi:hypothetical protein